MRSFSFLLVSVILCFVGCYGQVVQTIGQELGLSLLDGLLRRSKERMALTALKRQIEIYEKVDPQSAKLLKNVPTETMVGMIVDSQENQSPATGNPFLNILAKNGIVVNGQASKADNESQQGFPVAEVVQGLMPFGMRILEPSLKVKVRNASAGGAGMRFALPSSMPPLYASFCRGIFNPRMKYG
ncbi:hypothetical protein T4E_2488 [Trichinella pseudospiralis]|uniref:Uncharacterized protein n=1 Tax=Trichinella pseudospiralis TaxID=6337 RepID=A0A0V0XFW3_TRIPS|nr:hypothetical protein T4E_2488 [Trichinella pseudospiralis]